MALAENLFGLVGWAAALRLRKECRVHYLVRSRHAQSLAHHLADLFVRPLDQLLQRPLREFLVRFRQVFLPVPLHRAEEARRRRELVLRILRLQRVGLARHALLPFLRTGLSVLGLLPERLLVAQGFPRPDLVLPRPEPVLGLEVLLELQQFRRCRLRMDGPFRHDRLLWHSSLPQWPVAELLPLVQVVLCWRVSVLRLELLFELLQFRFGRRLSSLRLCVGRHHTSLYYVLFPAALEQTAKDSKRQQNVRSGDLPKNRQLPPVQREQK